MYEMNRIISLFYSEMQGVINVAGNSIRQKKARYY